MCRIFSVQPRVIKKLEAIGSFDSSPKRTHCYCYHFLSYLPISFLRIEGQKTKQKSKISAIEVCCQICISNLIFVLEYCT